MLKRLWNKAKAWWKDHPLTRDMTLAALAVLIGYLSQGPEVPVTYLMVRAALGEFIKRQGGPQV